MQIEILLKQKQEQNSGFRRVAWARTGTTLTSACAICRVVAHLAVALCSPRTLARTLIAAGCARSCRFLNSLISNCTKSRNNAQQYSGRVSSLNDLGRLGVALFNCDK